MNKILVVVSFVLAVILGGVAFRESKRSAEFRLDLVLARSEMKDVSGVLTEKNDEIARLAKRLDQMKQDVADLPRLRGEVTRLRTEAAALRKDIEVSEQRAAAARSVVSADRLAEALEKRAGNAFMTSMADLPSQIRDKINVQYPGADIAHIARMVQQGRTSYVLEGTTANDRNVKATLDENGEVIEQNLEVRFNELPDVVRQAAAQQLNSDGGIDMRQVWEGGRTQYRGNMERDGSEMRFVFSENGDLVRYETWVGEPDTDDTPGPP